MNALKQLSTLTKISIAIILFSMLMMSMSYIPLLLKWSIGPVALFVLGGIALSSALDDPEAEERVPLGLRLLIGFTASVPFGALTWLIIKLGIAPFIKGQ